MRFRSWITRLSKYGPLSSDTFIDVFYNADSGKRSNALVRDGIRVFGADNAFIGWHIHPFEDPDQHFPSPEISFKAFLEAIENHEMK